MPRAGTSMVVSSASSTEPRPSPVGWRASSRRSAACPGLGTFASKPEGTVFVVGGSDVQISYAGGTGNGSSLKLGGREMTNFRCDLLKPEAGDALRIGKISGDIAGGAIADPNCPLCS